MASPWETAAQQAVTSALEITNKLTASASAQTFPHLNDDLPLGNFNGLDEFEIKTNFLLFRIAGSMGAKAAALQFLAESDEVINISRGRNGFQNRVLRSQFAQSSTDIREQGPGWWPQGRPKEPYQ